MSVTNAAVLTMVQLIARWFVQLFHVQRYVFTFSITSKLPNLFYFWGGGRVLPLILPSYADGHTYKFKDQLACIWKFI